MSTKKKEQYNYWWLVALGLVPVLFLAWWQGQPESSSTDEVSSLEAFVEERWPSPPLPEGTEGLVADAMELACEGATACHVLWADHSDDEGFVLVASMDDDRLRDRKSTRLNSSHVSISYAVFCLKKKKKTQNQT